MVYQPTYREHAPSPDLAQRVSCYWTARHEASPRLHDVPLTDRVFPDACMDLLFDLSAGTAMLVGTMTRPLAISKSGPMDFLGVRFRPAGIGAVLSLPACEVTDTAIPVDVVWGARARHLVNGLQEASTTVARLSVIETDIRRRMSGGPGGDTLAHRAAGLVERARGSVSVQSLSDATGLGTRQLERRFLAAVGLAPKTACRVVRFQTALRHMHGRPGVALSRVALECGYHDQPHFTRDFRMFAHESPRAYRRRSGLDVAFVQDGALRAG